MRSLHELAHGAEQIPLKFRQAGRVDQAGHDDLQAAGSDLVPCRASSPQKLASATFHVPPCRTAEPDWFFSTGVPLSRMSYVTLAWVADVTDTESTFADDAAASAELACALTAAESCWPSSSSVIRLATGSLGLKNAVQFAAIVFWVAVCPDAADGLLAGVLLAGVLAGTPVVAALVVGAAVLDELELLLLHAVSAAQAAHATSVTIIRLLPRGSFSLVMAFSSSAVLRSVTLRTR